jgi:predicted GH43/DUF377 family glycosyl hydrolase
MLYRAITSKLQRGINDYINISVIGIAESEDGVNFENRRVFFGPEYHWECYSTEDPRISNYKGKFFICYTAVSKLPPDPKHVKLALATTEDFKSYNKEGIICPINSKAGVIFPRKFNGRYALMLTIYPDIPPSKIILVYFDKISDLKDPEFWKNVLSYPEREEAEVVLEGKQGKEFVEVGTTPIELDEGWLMFIPDIVYENGEFRSFRISAMLLDKEDPSEVIGFTKKPLLFPEVEYERLFNSPIEGIAFPSGAVLEGDVVEVYYGAADRCICKAYIEIDDLLRYLQ